MDGDLSIARARRAGDWKAFSQPLSFVYMLGAVWGADRAYLP